MSQYLVVPFDLPLKEQLLLLQEQLVTGLTGLRGAKTGSARRHRRLLRVWRTLQQRVKLRYTMKKTETQRAFIRLIIK